MLFEILDKIKPFIFNSFEVRQEKRKTGIIWSQLKYCSFALPSFSFCYRRVFFLLRPTLV